MLAGLEDSRQIFLPDERREIRNGRKANGEWGRAFFKEIPSSGNLGIHDQGLYHKAAEISKIVF